MSNKHETDQTLTKTFEQFMSLIQDVSKEAEMQATLQELDFDDSSERPGIFDTLDA